MRNKCGSSGLCNSTATHRVSQACNISVFTGKLWSGFYLLGQWPAPQKENMQEGSDCHTSLRETVLGLLIPYLVILLSCVLFLNYQKELQCEKK